MKRFSFNLQPSAFHLLFSTCSIFLLLLLCACTLQGQKLPVYNPQSVINNAILRYELQQAFPGLKTHDIKIGDEFYLKPTIPELWNFIQDAKIPEIHSHYLGDGASGSFDCEDYALSLHSQCRRKMADATHPWAFGEIWFETDRTKNHGYNICLTTKGFYLIEPQTREIWKLREKPRNIFFVYF